MDPFTRLALAVTVSAALVAAGCEQEASTTGTSGTDHSHAEGDDHQHVEGDSHEDDAHDLQPLGDVELGDMSVQAFQGHGEAAAGKELHLLVKLPDDVSGATVRAWIGTDDRYASVVALGTYAQDEQGYSLHATAPDPLPESAAWWIEVELADGTTHVGSVPVR
jgi:hypothetical protein